MPKRIIIATNNDNKMKEIRQILKDVNVDVLSMEEAGISMDIEETGESFSENSMIKAKALAELVPDDIVLADDSGLQIKYLHGEPGIYSARYLGINTPYSEKINAILKRMKNADTKEARAAEFNCVVSCIIQGLGMSVRGTVKGYITKSPKGTNGFGYDPIFYVEQYHRTMAELTDEEKNSISHRGQAFEYMKELLTKHEYI